MFKPIFFGITTFSNTVKDFSSGLLLNIYKPFQIDDLVEIGGFTGLRWSEVSRPKTAKSKLITPGC